MKNSEKSDGERTSLQERGWFYFHGLCLAIFFATTGVLCARTAQEEIFAAHAQAAYKRAQAEYWTQINNPASACEFARTCYNWADFATNKTERAAIAKDGIAACRRALLFTNYAAAHYYLGLNLGQLAQSETFRALRLVGEMEREFHTAADLDEQFDFAGPKRCLGLLYRDAPGWPLSIGNRHDALEFLQNAAALAPDDPENILNLAETYLKWGDTANARIQLEVLDTLWPKAQKSLTGESWEYDWYDWSRRRDAVRWKLTPAPLSHGHGRAARHACPPAWRFPSQFS
jgi:tetratricopeptide (TPR) repeat protein